MHRTDPPTISMVGTGSATMRAERSMMARSASVKLAAACSDNPQLAELAALP